MLSSMRKHASSWIIKFILGIIILAFIPFGYGIYQDRRGTPVATVNEDPIFFDDFNRVYTNLLAQVRDTYGGNLDEEALASLQLKRRAVDQLIERKLLLAEARRMDLKVSDQEVAQAIGSIEVFQTAGSFDPRRYEYILERNRLTTEMFEAQQKEDLLIEKLQRIMTEGVKVSEDEARQWYDWRNASVNLAFVKVPYVRYQEIDPGDEELREFFESNQENYRTEKQVKARYLVFAFDRYRDQVEVSEEELREYYDNHPDEFHTPKTVEARHVLIKVEQNAPEEAVETARRRAQEVHQKAVDGADFAELAVQYSEGPSADNGGYLGTFRRESMVAPFADKAFSMGAGEISEPVRTRFGWHVIKVEAVNEETTESFESARETIRNQKIDEKAKTRAYDEALLVYETTFEAEDLVRNAEERDMQLQQTDFFDAGGPESVGDRRRFASAALELGSGEVSDILELNDGYYLLQVTDIEPPRIPELEAVREDVRADLIRRKQEEKALQDAEAILAAVKAGKSLEEESAARELKVEQTGFFKRNAPIPKIGFERSLAEDAFALTPENALPEKAYQVDGNAYVVSFLSRKSAGDEDFQKEKDTVKTQLVQQKQFQALSNWLAQLREDSEIVYQEQFLQ